MWAQIVFSDLNEAVKRSLSPGETMLTGEAGTLALCHVILETHGRGRPRLIVYR